MLLSFNGSDKCNRASGAEGAHFLNYWDVSRGPWKKNGALLCLLFIHPPAHGSEVSPAARNTLDSVRIPRASKLLICGLFQKGRVLAQDGVSNRISTPSMHSGRPAPHMSRATRRRTGCCCQLSTRDAGISGGTLERPGLQRLLADIDAGLVEQVVVYKVDRLTRSLSDFAKPVERLEAAGAVFVSVTPSCAKTRPF